MSILFVIVDEKDAPPDQALLDGLAETAAPLSRSGVLWYEAADSTSGSAAPCCPGSLTSVVLRPPQPMGYGDKLKMGLDLALREGFQTAVILDGQSRYPLDGIGRMLEGLAKGADMVLAIPSSRANRLGGFGDYLSQPGARFAARLLNLLAKGKLTGWHCGFRAYRMAALRQVPFENNEPSRAFNTEIIIQFLLCGLKVAEMPMPGYRHQDMPLVEKTRFALSMIKASVLSLLHRMSLFYQRQYDVVEPLDTYALKLGYASSHSRALEIVPRGSRLLDIGCGPGSLAAEFARRGCEVHGLDQHDLRDSKGLARYEKIDLDVREHAFPVSNYGYILLMDVLEHLRNPEAMLEHIRAKCGKGNKPILVISVPNVAFFIIRLRLLFGTFHYGKLGILDLTHTRLFTESSMTNLLTRHGYKILGIEGIPAPYPKAIGLNGFSRALLGLNQLLIRFNRRLFSYQILLTATPTPTLDDLLP